MTGNQPQVHGVFLVEMIGYTLEDQHGTYKSTHLERKMIFQTSMIMFHVNLQGRDYFLVLLMFIWNIMFPRFSDHKNTKSCLTRVYCLIVCLNYNFLYLNKRIPKKLLLNDGPKRYLRIYILIGFSIINHPFWGTPIFGNTHFALFRWSDLWKVQTGDEAMQSWMQLRRPCDAPVEQPEEVGLNRKMMWMIWLINTYTYTYLIYNILYIYSCVFMFENM